MLNTQSNLQSDLRRNISFQVLPGRDVGGIFMEVFSSSFGVYRIAGYIKSENRLHKFAYKPSEEPLSADAFLFAYRANKCMLMQKGKTVFDQLTVMDAYGIIVIEFAVDMSSDTRAAIIINIYQKGEKSKSFFISSSDKQYVALVRTVDRIICS